MLTERQRAARIANLRKAGPLTAAGRQRLRLACLRDRPWRFSRGPRTPEGKSRARMNALRHGERDAGARSLPAWLRSARRFVDALDYVLSMASGGRPRRPRRGYTPEEVSRLVRCAMHFPPSDDTDTATAWLAEHARLRGSRRRRGGA